MHTSPLKSALAGFQKKMNTIIDMIQCTTDIRSSLQMFSHTLSSDPQQRWHSARKDIEKAITSEKSFQDGFQLLTLSVDKITKTADEIMAKTIQPSLEKYAYFCERVKVVFYESDTLHNPKVKASKKPYIDDVMSHCSDALVCGNQCKDLFSVALTSYNEIASSLEKTVQEMYTQFFTAGYETFHPASGDAAKAEQNSIVRSSLEDFVDLEQAHSNSIGRLAELSSSPDITKPDAQLLFGPITSLLSVHSQLFMTIDKILREKPRKPDEEIAKRCIQEISNAMPIMMTCYPDFIQSESAAVPLFNYLKENVFPFGAMVKKLPPSFDFATCRSCALPHLKQYKTILESWAGKYEGGRVLLAKCSTLLDLCNAAKMRSEAVKRLVKLKQSFTGFDDIVNFYREHVYDGTVCVLPSREACNESGLNAGDSYHLFIFSDCWVLAADVGGHYYLLAKGELATTMYVMSPRDNVTGVTLTLSWTGPKINVEAITKPKEPAEPEKKSHEKHEEKKHPEEKAPVSPVAPAVEEEILERRVMVKFTIPSDETQERNTRELIRKVFENRWRHRVFGVDVARLTSKDTIFNPLPLLRSTTRPSSPPLPPKPTRSPSPPPISLGGGGGSPPRSSSLISRHPPNLRTTTAFTRGVIPPKQVEIPLFLKEMERVIRENDGYNAVGIFRISSGTSEMERMVIAIDAGIIPKIFNPFLGASLIRLWLRKMPEGLLTSSLYSSWLSVSDSIQNQSKCLEMCKNLVGKLPPGNKLILSFLLKTVIQPIVKNKAVNKMSSHNVAIILSPSILRPSDIDERNPYEMAVEAGRACSVVEFLIDNAAKLL